MLIIQHVSPKNEDILLHNCSKINTLQFKIDKTLQFYIQSFPIVLVSSTAVFFFPPFSIPSRITHCILFGGLFISLYSRFFSFYDLDIFWRSCPFIFQNICLAVSSRPNSDRAFLSGIGDLCLSQCITLGDTWYPFGPLLFILSLVTWVSWCLPNFSIIRVRFFIINK